MKAKPYHTKEWFLEQYHTVFGGLVYDKYSQAYPVDGVGGIAPSHENEIIEKIYCEQMISLLSTDWQKKVVRLRLDGYDNATIAEMEGCGYGSVSQALRQARKRLRNTSIDPRRGDRE